MSGTLKNILFRTVLVVLLLHIFIPHPHAEVLNKETHARLHHNTNSILGLLEIFFHESHDEDLDNLTVVPSEFHKKSGNTFYLSYLTVNSTSFNLVENFSTEKITINSNKSLYCTFVLNAIELRGPPSGI